MPVPAHDEERERPPLPPLPRSFPEQAAPAWAGHDLYLRGRYDEAESA
jgi:hypothetical protein